MADISIAKQGSGLAHLFDCTSYRYKVLIGYGLLKAYQRFGKSSNINSVTLGFAAYFKVLIILVESNN